MDGASPGDPAPAGVSRITGRRIYILPSGYGLVYAVLVLAILIGSVNYNNNLGFLLAFLLVGLGLVAMVHTWRNLYGLEFRVLPAAPVFAGERARFPVELYNSDRSPRADLALDLPGGLPGTTDLEPRSNARLEVKVSATRRGELSPGSLRIQTRFPLGLFRAWSYLEPEVRTLVYPRPASRAAEPDQASHAAGGLGDRGVGTDDFAGLRAYQPGDSPRHIDWKALARERGLLAKQFGGDRAERLWVDWEAWPGLDTEARLSRLCRAVLDAAARPVEFGLRIPGRQIAPDRGSAHRARCLATLARYEGGR